MPKEQGTKTCNGEGAERSLLIESFFFFLKSLGAKPVPYLEFFEQGGSADVISFISGGQR